MLPEACPHQLGHLAVLHYIQCPVRRTVDTRSWEVAVCFDTLLLISCSFQHPAQTFSEAVTPAQSLACYLVKCGYIKELCLSPLHKYLLTKLQVSVLPAFHAFYPTHLSRPGSNIMLRAFKWQWCQYAFLRPALSLGFKSHGQLCPWLADCRTWECPVIPDLSCTPCSFPKYLGRILPTATLRCSADTGHTSGHEGCPPEQCHLHIPGFSIREHVYMRSLLCISLITLRGSTAQHKPC